jgi:hypothetical protein
VRTDLDRAAGEAPLAEVGAALEEDAAFGVEDGGVDADAAEAGGVGDGHDPLCNRRWRGDEEGKPV